MRIVATSDTHFPFSEDMIPSGDVFIHAGDLMYSGLPDEWPSRLDSLRDIEGFKHKLIIPGNHDYHMQHYAGIASSELRRAGMFLLTDYRPTVRLDNVNYLGIPFVTGLPGWAFNREEDWVYDWLQEVTKDFKPDVVISHAPMFNMLDAVYPDKKNHRDQIHVGGLATNRWFHKLENKPSIWINGHIHESYGRASTEGCTFYNVAMCDRAYDQTNKPMIIDLETV